MFKEIHMIEGIYREIIEDSPVAFLHIKAEKVRDIYSKVKRDVDLH